MSKVSRRAFLLGTAATIGAAGLPIPKSPVAMGVDPGVDHRTVIHEWTGRGWVMMRQWLDDDGTFHSERVDPKEVYQTATIQHEMAKLEPLSPKKLDKYFNGPYPIDYDGWPT